MSDDNLAGPSNSSNKTQTKTSTATTKQRKRRSHKVWVFEKKFPTLPSAEEFIKNEKVWSYLKSHKRDDGVKRFYRCNMARKRATQCSAAVYLWINTLNDEISLYRTESAHDHETTASRIKYGLTEEAKEAVEDLFQSGLKAKQIMIELQKIEGLLVPSMKQLHNYIANLRTKFGDPGLSLGEFEPEVTISVNENTESEQQSDDKKKEG